ncbi:MAG TPA: hypothetical protein VFW42_00605 [Fluviicoccus sp.]|nr:hypothetical protein [Fluviicoccus sp.]
MKKFLLALPFLLLAGCDQPPPSGEIRKVDTGRKETRTLEAASAVGYDGKAIRQKVDKGLDANDEYNRKLQEQADQ